MDKSDPVFQEFIGYWRLSEEMVTKASREEVVGWTDLKGQRSAPLDSTSSYFFALICLTHLSRIGATMS